MFSYLIREAPTPECRCWLVSPANLACRRSSLGRTYWSEANMFAEHYSEPKWGRFMVSFLPSWGCSSYYCGCTVAVSLCMVGSHWPLCSAQYSRQAISCACHPYRDPIGEWLRTSQVIALGSQCSFSRCATVVGAGRASNVACGFTPCCLSA